nr:c-type cytochrome [Fimbriiglobus sp.]
KKGNAENGKALLAKSLTGEAQCLKCHMVKGTGGSIGPDLSMIGLKASKENLYDSLLTPSKAIADQYLSWRIDSEDGQSITGLLVSETETSLTVRDANGKDYTFSVKDVRKKKDPKSIMPDDVIKAFSEDELIDVVEYLTTLRTPSFTADSWLIAGPFPAEGDKALDTDFGPEKKAFDVAATFKAGGKDVAWRTVRGDAKGYIDLAALHGGSSANSVSYMARTIESPADQEVTILLGTDDGCRLWVNGEKVFGHERHEAAAPARDAVKVKLKRGSNVVLLKVNNGNNPHGFYFTIEGGLDLKLGK